MVNQRQLHVMQSGNSYTRHQLVSYDRKTFTLLCFLDICDRRTELLSITLASNKLTKSDRLKFISD